MTDNSAYRDRRQRMLSDLKIFIDLSHESTMPPIGEGLHTIARRFPDLGQDRSVWVDAVHYAYQKYMPIQQSLNHAYARALNLLEEPGSTDFSAELRAIVQAPYGVTDQNQAVVPNSIPTHDMVALINPSMSSRIVLRLRLIHLLVAVETRDDVYTRLLDAIDRFVNALRDQRIRASMSNGNTPHHEAAEGAATEQH